LFHLAEAITEKPFGDHSRLGLRTFLAKLTVPVAVAYVKKSAPILFKDAACTEDPALSIKPTRTLDDS
jgi:hypothetical protein